MAVVIHLSSAVRYKIIRIMKVLLLIIIALFICSFVCSKYQSIKWFAEAEKIYMAKFKELKSLDYSYLLSKIGQPHEYEEKIVNGHLFLIGWMVNEPGAIGGFVNDKLPINNPSKPLNEIDEVEIKGYVDFVYPIPFTKRIHKGWSINFFKKKDGGIRLIYPMENEQIKNV
jgi:hypothetical protein